MPKKNLYKDLSYHRAFISFDFLADKIIIKFQSPINSLKQVSFTFAALKNYAPTPLNILKDSNFTW